MERVNEDSNEAINFGQLFNNIQNDSDQHGNHSSSDRVDQQMEVAELDGDSDTQENLIAIPMFEDDMDPPSVHDEWCFLCEKKPLGDDNTYYKTLLQLFNPPGNMSTIKVYQLVQQYYDKYFRAYNDGKEWTLNSIARHRNEHMCINKTSMRAECNRILFAQLQFLSRTGMRYRNPVTGEQTVNVTGTKLCLSIIKQIAMLQSMENN